MASNQEIKNQIGVLFAAYLETEIQCSFSTSQADNGSLDLYFSSFDKRGNEQDIACIHLHQCLPETEKKAELIMRRLKGDIGFTEFKKAAEQIQQDHLASIAA